MLSFCIGDKNNKIQIVNLNLLVTKKAHLKSGLKIFIYLHSHRQHSFQ
jgi:hypothetical protein